MKKARSGHTVRIILTAMAILGAGPVVSAQYVPENSNRIVISFNTGWLYADADIDNGESVSLNESAFEEGICLPHANRIMRHRGDSEERFRFISWYRKHYSPPSEYAGRRFILHFQGVATAAMLSVNGRLAGEHKGAYTGFSFDITDELTIGEDNVIAVQVDSRQRRDIPPEGGNLDFMIFGGIIRDVEMIVTDPLHVDWIFVSTPNPTASGAVVNAKARIVNSGDNPETCTVITSIVDTDNNVVASVEGTATIAAHGSHEFDQVTGSIAGPRLWHPDHPYLYDVYTQVRDEAGFVDEYREKLGIRSVHFSDTDGRFSINGEPLKLMGMNRHDTYPIIGRAAANRLQRKEADILKYDLGSNMVRLSHYPQDPDFLRRCDEIGLLLLEEIPGWMYIGGSDWQDLELQTLEEMIIRDRNHPSIVSFGVRINESADNHEFYIRTNNLARELDPTRQTHGVRRSNGSTDEFLEDIWSRNFAIPSGTPDPMPWLTTETVGHGFPTHSWDDNQRLIDHMMQHVGKQRQNYQKPELAGVLAWHAFDYNSSHSNAVDLEDGAYVSYHGVADIFRILKPAGYFFQSQRDPGLYGPMVYITHQWERALSPNNVIVVSNCDEVELFVNGTSRGRIEPNNATELPHGLFQWNNMPFSPGELRAVGYIGGQESASHTVSTPGNPVKLIMKADDETLLDGGDMTRVVVTAVDENGQAVPRSSNSVTLGHSGAGELLAFSPVALEDGKTAFYVKTKEGETGSIMLQASSSGLSPATASIAVTNSAAGMDRRPEPASTAGHWPKVVKTLLSDESLRVPEWAAGAPYVYLYDLAGNRVARIPAGSSTINVTGKGTARGIYFLKFK